MVMGVDKDQSIDAQQGLDEAAADHIRFGFEQLEPR
jgi:hypothetical protein